MDSSGSGQAPRRHAQAPKAAKAAAKERNNLLQEKLKGLRDEMAERITQIADETGKDRRWVEMQMYQGGKMLRQRRAVNPYNAAISRAAKERREQGLPSHGKQTIAILSKEVSASGEWKDTSDEERKDMIDDLTLKRESKLRPVTEKMVGHEVQSTMGILETEAVGLAKRAGSEYLVLTVNSGVTDTWDARVLASSGVEKALENIYKQTSEVFAMKVQAFINAGVPGVVKMTKENPTVSLKSAIRDTVLKDLHTILTDEKGLKEESLPPRMEWARYEALVATYGVELRGWTGPDGVCNPDKLKGIAELQRLKNALDARRCLWVVLTEDEWAAKKVANDDRIASKAKGKGKASAADSNSVAMEVDHDVPGITQASIPGFIFPPVVPPIPAAYYSSTGFVQGSSTGVQGWL